MPREAQQAKVQPATTVPAEPAEGQPIPINAAAGPDAAALAVITASLAGAGRRARSRKAQTVAARPDPAYSEALRDRLIRAEVSGGGAAAAGTAGDAVGPAEATREAGDRTAPAARANEKLGPLSRPRVGAGAATRAADTGGPKATPRRRRVWTWAAFGALVLVLAVAAVGVAGGRFASTPTNRAGDVAGTTLLRAGASSALSTGTALAVGDELRVAPAGHATLDLGANLARLAGGADVRLDGLSPSTVQFTLLAGRVYSRVALPAGGSYAVVAGPYTWTATGTAFDLDLKPGSAGTAQISLLALEHSVAVSGPDTETEIPEGNLATIQLGGANPAALQVGPIPTSAFTDPWLIANAQADERLGDPIGALAGVALAPNGTPTSGPSQSVVPSSGPVESPSPSGQPTAGDVPSPSPRPTPTPTIRATPTPTAIPSPTATATAKPSFNLTSTSCPGGLVLSWSKYTGSGFVKYVTLRDGTPISTASTTKQGTTVGFDQIEATTHYYQTEVVGAGGKVLAASPVRTFYGLPAASLGPLGVSPDYGLLVWSARSFPKGCFTEYQINYTFPPFSQPTLVVTNAAQGNVPIPGWGSGQSATFTVVAIRQTPLGPMTVGSASPFTTTHP